MSGNLHNNKILRQIIIFMGIIVSAIGINLFLTPANLLSSGLAGIVVIIGSVFEINQAWGMLMFNIPIFILSRKYVDKEFFYSSLINMFVFAIALGVTGSLAEYTTLDDVMLQCIFGGLITGLGTGIVFKMNSSVGGLDIVAAVLKIRYNVSIKNAYLFINFFIILIGGLLFGVRAALYTMLSMYVTAVAIEAAKDSFNKQYSVLVISDKNKEITEAIMNDLKRGVTLIDAEGAYTKNKKQLIFCVVESKEVGKIKGIVYEKDSNAFISINDTNEVKGGGFRGKLL